MPARVAAFQTRAIARPRALAKHPAARRRASSTVQKRWLEGSTTSSASRAIARAASSEDGATTVAEHATSEPAAYDELGDDGEFEFEPYALYFAVRAWYAVGLHNERDGIRTLKLNRFTMVSPTERAFQIPDGFSLDGLLGNAWRMIRGEPDYEVELRFDPQFAETIADTLWHKTQRLEEHEDGSLTFRCTVAGLNEIVWWVLSMGPHCRVIAPEELREQVKNAVLTTADLYS